MIKVGIVGGTGYTGVELLRLLAQHPQVQLHSITSRTEAGMAVAEMFPSLRGRVHLQFTTPDTARLNECDAVFFATPHGVAMAQARDLLAANVKILDLAADFRLQDTAVFEKWYGMPHACPEILKEAVYGLPEINREAIKKARIIGLAGCYPTSVQLGFAPLLSPKNGHSHPLIETQSLIADCKSGTSGAGRKAEIPTLLSEASDNFKAYGVKGHRHLPEITQGLKVIAGHDNIALNVRRKKQILGMGRDRRKIRSLLSRVVLAVLPCCRVRRENQLIPMSIPTVLHSPLHCVSRLRLKRTRRCSEQCCRRRGLDLHM